MFQGFSDAAIDFMWGVRFNNERGWFNEHKQEYQTYFYEPMRELAQDVFQRLDKRYPDVGLFCKVSRIYRDARRLHGRGPYKDHLWFCIRGPGEQWHDHPTFWFELAPEQWSYGLGFWCAQAATMAKFRARLDRDPKQAEQLIRTAKRNLCWRDRPTPRQRPRPLPSWRRGTTRKIFPFSIWSPTPPSSMTAV